MALYLIDGHAIAYRSHFAFIRNPLTNTKGENTSAVFGFLRTLQLLMKKYHPEHLAVIFDSEEETGRHREFPDYKAQREEMPDELEVQIPWILDLLEAMGIPVLTHPGYEADDVIATLARQAEVQGEDVRIVTGDKDLFQLLSDRIHILRPSRGTGLEDEITMGYLEKRFGLRPGQIVDLLALMGDSSDNIPGVKGIGEKTALKLLHRFGSLDAVLERIDEVEPGHVQSKIRTGREDALFSRGLVTLQEVPLGTTWEDCTIGEPDNDRLTEILLRLEFHQILRELTPQRPDEPDSVDYELLDQGGLADLASTLGGVGEFVIDVETTSLDPLRAEIVGISLCTEPGKTWYIPVETADRSEDGGLFPAGGKPAGRGIPLEVVRAHLDPMLSDEKVGKIGHNIKYDCLVLEAHGFTVAGVSFDTMIASYCLDPERRSHSLDNLTLEFCRHTMISYGELFNPDDKVRDIRTVPLERLSEYSCEDADYTMRLKMVLADRIDESGYDSLFREVEMPLCLVLKRMEQAGVALDCRKLEKLSGEVAGQLEQRAQEIYGEAGEEFNINSGKQLQRILFEKLGLPPLRRTKTGYSTDVEVLMELAGEHRIAGLVLEYRQLAKLAGTYIDALPRLVNPDTGRIHTSFNQTVTATGRLSSSDPNLQNIPIRTELGRRIRRAFVARRGHLLMDADYSQIELRIMAHLSGDPSLVEAFHDGIDIHTRTAARIYGIDEGEVDAEKRSRAKTINFGVIYGMGARGLSRQLGIPVAEAKQFIEDYFASYPGVKAYIDRSIGQARERGYAETLMGRRRNLPDIASGDGRVRSFSERIAVNMPIQGTAADMIKVAMIDIDRGIRGRGLGSRMVLQVHDELVFEVPLNEREDIEELVRRSMESALRLEVPLEVEIGFGKDWVEAHR
ncbi:MAG: DNA polymerase I [bacterium]|nr:MAG: DNA polymerase I [bacterium]